MDQQTVTYHWKNRDKHDRIETETIRGVEFVARFLRHVLPVGFHALRHYGFHHPAAKAKREKIAFYAGQALWLTPKPVPPPDRSPGIPKCPCCERPMRPVCRLAPVRSPRISRGPITIDLPLKPAVSLFRERTAAAKPESTGTG